MPLSHDNSSPLSDYSSYHLLIRFKGNLENVSLLSLGKEEEHGFGFVCCRADEDHASLWIIQVILRWCREKGSEIDQFKTTMADFQALLHDSQHILQYSQRKPHATYNYAFVKTSSYEIRSLVVSRICGREET